MTAVYISQFSAGRPGKVTARKEVHMQMRHSFTGVFAMIDHESKALRLRIDSKLPGNLTRGEKHRPESCLICGFGLTETRDDLPWDDEHVNRSLRIDIVECNAVFVLVHERRGDFAVDDLLKNGLF